MRRKCCTKEVVESELGLKRWILFAALQKRFQLASNMSRNAFTRGFVALAFDPYLYKAADSFDLVLAFLEYANLIPIPYALEWLSMARVSGTYMTLLLPSFTTRRPMFSMPG